MGKQICISFPLIQVKANMGNEALSSCCKEIKKLSREHLLFILEMLAPNFSTLE